MGVNMQYTLTELERNAYMAGNPISDDIFEPAIFGDMIRDESDPLGDIVAGFPEEDCLSSEIAELSEVIAGMCRSDAKTRLTQLLEDLREKQTALARSAEYGMSELRKTAELLGVSL